MASVEYYQHLSQGDAPVTFEGLEFHPLLVRDYGIYARAKQAFELMLGSLSPKLARLPWAACLWAIDQECEKQTGNVGEYLVSALYVLAKALRLDEFVENGTFPLRPVFAQNGTLTAVMIGEVSGNYTLFNMQQMDEVRKIIAAQNGYDIPNENWNPELVRAAQQNSERNSLALNTDFETLLYSVAVNAHCRAKDIYDWSIKEFHGMQSAIDRSYGHLIYTLAEASGNVTFKQGNPYPSWKFDRKNDLPTGFVSISDLDAGAKGLVAGT